MTTYRSPNELLEAAKKAMLGGRNPTSLEDWYRIMNFFAANLADYICEQACLLFKHLYEIPLHDDEVKNIVKYQMERRGEKWWADS